MFVQPLDLLSALTDDGLEPVRLDELDGAGTVLADIADKRERIAC
jgi:hypothetical protein